MRRTRVLALSLFAMTLAATAPRVGHAGPEADIKAVDDKFALVFNKMDVDGIAALYAEDAIAMFPGGDLWHKGRPAIRQAFIDFFAGCESPKLVMHDATYHNSGDVGYNSGLFDLTFKDLKTGTIMDMRGRFVGVMEKRDGKWVYVLDHASVPMPSGPEAEKQPGGADEHHHGGEDHRH